MDVFGILEGFIVEDDVAVKFIFLVLLLFLSLLLFDLFFIFGEDIAGVSEWLRFFTIATPSQVVSANMLLILEAATLLAFVHSRTKALLVDS